MSGKESKIIDIHAGLRDVDTEQRAGSCVMVIFGGAGDLTRRKIIPAMYNAMQEGLTPEGFTIIGAGRGEMSHDQYRHVMEGSIREFTPYHEVNEDTLHRFLSGLYFVGGEFDDPAMYMALESLIKACGQDGTGSDNRIYYLSTPPGAFPPK